MDLVVPVAMKLTSFDVDFLDLGGGYFATLFILLAINPRMDF